MHRYIASFVTAALVTLCVLFAWGIGQGQERTKTVTCRVLSDEEAKRTKLFKEPTVVVKCPSITLWIPRTEYRIAEACSTVRLVRDKDGLHWADTQEGKCVVKDTVTTFYDEIANQRCQTDKITSGYDAARQNIQVPVKPCSVSPKWR